MNMNLYKPLFMASCIVSVQKSVVRVLDNRQESIRRLVTEMPDSQAQQFDFLNKSVPLQNTMREAKFVQAMMVLITSLLSVGIETPAYRKNPGSTDCASTAIPPFHHSNFPIA